MTTTEALRTLELKTNPTLKEIKTAYRELSQINHPDKAPEHLKERATKKQQQLNEAYKHLETNGAGFTQETRERGSEEGDVSPEEWERFMREFEEFSRKAESEILANYEREWELEEKQSQEEARQMCVSFLVFLVDNYTCIVHGCVNGLASLSYVFPNLDYLYSNLSNNKK